MMGTIPPVLAQILELLTANNASEWATLFSHLAAEISQEPLATNARIRSTFGGMGSFNDLVLHTQDGKPLPQENDRLAQLRNKLYELTHV